MRFPDCVIFGKLFFNCLGLCYIVRNVFKFLFKLFVVSFFLFAIIENFLFLSLHVNICSDQHLSISL